MSATLIELLKAHHTVTFEYDASELPDYVFEAMIFIHQKNQSTFHTFSGYGATPERALEDLNLALKNASHLFK